MRAPARRAGPAHHRTEQRRQPPAAHRFDAADPATERAVASAIAERMRQLFDDPGWQYTTFYSATRGMDATAAEVESLVERARQVGIRLADSEQR